MFDDRLIPKAAAMALVLATLDHEIVSKDRDACERLNRTWRRLLKHPTLLLFENDAADMYELNLDDEEDVAGEVYTTGLALIGDLGPGHYINTYIDLPGIAPYYVRATAAMWNNFRMPKEVAL